MLHWAEWNFRRLCEYYAIFFLIKSILFGLAIWCGSMPWGMDLPDFCSVTHMMQRTKWAEKHLSLFTTMFLWYLLDSFKSKQTFCEFNVVYRLGNIFSPLYHNVVSCIYKFWWPWHVYFSPFAPIRNRKTPRKYHIHEGQFECNQTDRCFKKKCFS